MAMQFDVPFAGKERAVEQPNAEQRYNAAVQRLAYGVVYEDMSPEQLRRRIDLVREEDGIPRREQKKRQLEALQAFAEGMEAHEQANQVFLGGWQEALASVPHPEGLTREQVAELFEAFPDREALEKAEDEAIARYTDMLSAREDVALPVYEDRITLTGADITVLVNDLRVRKAERVLDTDERKKQLEALDNALAETIEGLSDDDWGKRLELEEIYLLRRLVHDADMGHVASVEHATPREDLRIDRGSVDLRLTAAGEVFPFQVKTFKSGVHTGVREQQQAMIEKAQRRLRNADTHLVTLETESVQEAYNTALRRPTDRRTTVADKYAALRPLTEVPSFSPEVRGTLLQVTGMTEDDLAQEKAEVDARYTALRENQARYFLREAEQLRAFQEEEAEEQARQEEAERREREQARLAEDRIRERAAVATAKQRAAEVHVREKAAEAEARRVEQARLAAEEEAAEAKRQAVQQKRAATREAREAEGWPPKQFLGMLSAPLLQRLRFLSADWDNDPQALLSAKKEFLRLFAKPKKGASPTEKDAPNAFFKQVFAQASDFESPSEVVLARIHTAEAKKAA